MGKKKTDGFEDAVHVLLEGDTPRVWSLIVTVFGDLAQDEGSALSGALLAEILTPLGIKPEAMRVALHRLRNEGWIETQKRGREALHGLSAKGRKESRAASLRIYAAERTAGDEWHMICLPPVVAPEEQARASSLSKAGYVALGHGVYLANSEQPIAPTGALKVSGAIGTVPRWVRDCLVKPSLNSAFKDLSAALGLIAWNSDAFTDLDPAKIAALRVLIVHRWRKLALRLPDAPDVLFGPQFSGFTCRAQVMEALEALPRPDLSALQSA